MKTEMVKDLKAEDVKQIWVSYLSEKGRLSDVLNVILNFLYLEIYSEDIIYKILNKIPAGPVYVNPK